MKIAKTTIVNWECFIIMTHELPDRDRKQEIEQQVFHKYGHITIYFISSKPEEGDLWITNKYGLDRGRHDFYKEIEFDI